MLGMINFWKKEVILFLKFTINFEQLSFSTYP